MRTPVIICTIAIVFFSAPSPLQADVAAGIDNPASLDLLGQSADQSDRIGRHRATIALLETVAGREFSVGATAPNRTNATHLGAAKDTAEAFVLAQAIVETSKRNKGNTRDASTFEDAKGTDAREPDDTQHVRAAADACDAEAMFNLGYAYDYGEGVELDEAEGARWYRKAAEAGHVKAMYSLGYAYDYGQGVELDEAEGVRWYRKAAEAGHATAMYNLGYAYDYGEGVELDEAEGVRWYRKAAEAGNASAMNNLGYAYKHGEGVAED